MPTCIDVFAGCGGLSLGLTRAGFEPLFAVERHPSAFATYKHNLIDDAASARWPDWLPLGPINAHCLVDDHHYELAALRGMVDLVAGGPPCQGFSTNGRRDPGDPRNALLDTHLNIVDILRPSLVLIENVRGFASMPHPSGGTFPDYLSNRLAELGYDCWSQIVMASDYGVPQRRPRFIMLAAASGALPGINPFERLRVGRRAFLASHGLGPGETSAFEAIGDLEIGRTGTSPDPEWGTRGYEEPDWTEPEQLGPYLRLMRHGAAGRPRDMRLARHRLPSTERMRQILATCVAGRPLSTRDRARLGMAKRTTTPLAADAPAPTISTLPDDLVHYREPRTMTVREHARLQSFPDWFSFQGKYTTGGEDRTTDCPRYTQVANAVPPLLAEALGAVLIGLLRDLRKSGPDRCCVAAKPREGLGRDLEPAVANHA